MLSRGRGAATSGSAASLPPPAPPGLLLEDLRPLPSTVSRVLLRRVGGGGFCCAAAAASCCAASRSASWCMRTPAMSAALDSCCILAQSGRGVPSARAAADLACSLTNSSLVRVMVRVRVRG